ncbi:hypothetical protein FRB98_006725 [Tulasnella sp. 332]|nr:hypothetical protein FRB98_006725 [Tulasnella sp. 332]
MHIGQVISMPHFTMMDAMNAIEIMDPRMDNGMKEELSVQATGYSKKSADEFNVQTPLLSEEMAWIFDRAIAAEMGWHEGKFMSQTIHTLQYVHDLYSMASVSTLPPQSEEDMRKRPRILIATVLRPLVIGMLKSCDLTWRQLLQRFVYDAEDWHSEKFEVPLCENFQTSQVVEQLDTAESWLKSSPELPYCDALLARVRLRKSLLRLLSHLSSSLEGVQIPLLLEARSLLEAVVHRYPVPDPENGSPAWAAFDPTICRKLTAVTPLKAIPLMEQGDAWVVLKRMLDELYELYSLAHEGSYRTVSWMEVLRTHGKNWFLRLAVSEITTIPDRYLPTLSNAANEQLMRAGAIEQSGFLIAQLVDLENRLHELIDHMFMTLNQNRPRMRRNFSKVFLAWHRLEDDMQALMNMIEQSLQHLQIPTGITARLPLVTHYLRNTLVVDHIFSGFELELYNPSEYQLMYWHLSVILQNQVSTIQDLIWIAEQNGEQDEMSTRYLRSQNTWYAALRTMCEVRFQMLVHLRTPIGSRGLFPRLDMARQRINMERRFDWSFPSPEENIGLIDVAQPDWAAYMTRVDGVLADDMALKGDSSNNLPQNLQLSPPEQRHSSTLDCAAVYDNTKGMYPRSSHVIDLPEQRATMLGLPPELGSAILIAATSDSRDAPYYYYLQLETFRLVSHDWNYNILSIGYLWSILQAQQKPQMVKRCLERSAGCALDVYMRRRLDANPMPTDEFAEQLLPYIQRIRVLDLILTGVTDYIGPAIMALLASQLPALTDLSISEHSHRRLMRNITATAGLQRLVSLKLEAVEVNALDLVACTRLRCLTLRQACSLFELLSILAVHSHLEVVLVELPLKITHMGGTAPSGVQLQNLHTLSLLEVNTMEVFGFIRCLVLPPEAKLTVKCRLYDDGDAMITMCMAPFLRYLASKLADPSTPQMIDTIFIMNSAAFQLPGIILSIRCGSYPRANWSSGWKLIFGLIHTIIGSRPIRATFHQMTSTCSEGFTLMIGQLARNIREMVAKSDVSERWIFEVMGGVTTATVVEGDFRPGAVQMERLFPALRSFEGTALQRMELFVDCIERRSRVGHQGGKRLEPAPLKSIRLHGTRCISDYHVARLRAVVDEVSWTSEDA